MAFLNPAFLSALALAGIPLIIHLIRRRKLVVIHWAAMEFLRQSQKKQKRRLRIEELILLTLRMLIVALAVLAFARPVLRALGIPLLSNNTRVYAVIVLDNSYSMEYAGTDGKTSFERAQLAADDIVTHVLKQGDAVSVVLLSDKPEALVGAPSYDLKLVRQRILAAKVADRATDYLAGAQAVSRLLNASKNPVKEVYWLSDDQEAAWTESHKDSARVIWGALGKDARLTWTSVGPGTSDRENLAIQTPIVGRELVTPHLPTRIETRVVNSGSRPRNDVAVNLLIDGKPAGATRTSVPANGSAMVQFMPLFNTAGAHVGRIELADAKHADGLVRDNSASFVVRCRDRIRILLQDTHPMADSTRSESLYLLTAMAPNDAAASLSPKLHNGQSFGSLNLHDYDAIVITGVSGLSPNDRAVLSEFVRSGGGVLLLPGAETDPRRVSADLETSGLLPARIGARRTLPDENSITLHPDTIPANHAALGIFRDTSVMNLASPRFTAYYPLEPIADETNANATRVILRFSNGDPAFVEREVGLGKVIIGASPMGGAWNQLSLKPVFVPLVYQLLSYLGEGATSHRNLKQESPFFVSLLLTDANKPVRVTTPDNKTVSQNSVVGSQGVTFTYSSTGQAGVYRLSVVGSNRTDSFAVGLPTGESNLTYTDPGPAAEAAGFPSGRLVVAHTPSQMLASINRARYGAEVWRPLIWLIVPLLFLESLLAQVWGRRG